MKNLKLSIHGVLAIAGVALANPAMAGDVPCPPSLGNVTVEGNVVVTSACRLDGTVVRGNVHVYEGGSLIARNARIEGSVQSVRASGIDIRSSSVNGSIQIDNTVGATSAIVATGVGGSIQMKDNFVRLEVLGNEVGADVQAFANQGGVVVEQNIIDGNLQCKDNFPAPVGGNNRVGGNREDQCANLQPEGSVIVRVLNASTTSTAASATVGTGSLNDEGGGGSFGISTLLGLLGAGLLSTARRQRPVARTMR